MLHKQSRMLRTNTSLNELCEKSKFQSNVHIPAVNRVFKFNFQYRYQQQVMPMHCARKKPEEKCIGSRHYRSQGYFGSRGKPI